MKAAVSYRRDDAIGAVEIERLHRPMINEATKILDGR